MHSSQDHDSLLAFHSKQSEPAGKSFRSLYVAGFSRHVVTDLSYNAL